MGVEDILTEWSARVVGTMHRCYISQAELAHEMGVSRQRLSRVLTDRPPTNQAKGRVDTALRSCLLKKGLPADEIYPEEARPD